MHADLGRLKKGTILVGAKGCPCRVKRIKTHSDRPDDIIVESMTAFDADGSPVELNGHYTTDDLRSGRLRFKEDAMKPEQEQDEAVSQIAVEPVEAAPEPQKLIEASRVFAVRIPQSLFDSFTSICKAKDFYKQDAGQAAIEEWVAKYSAEIK